MSQEKLSSHTFAHPHTHKTHIHTQTKKKKENEAFKTRHQAAEKQQGERAKSGATYTERPSSSSSFASILSLRKGASLAHAHTRTKID
jgi:hypothetical protein